MQRFILEMGMGSDLHGGDYTKAARRAIEDALHHSTLALFSAPELDPATMEVRVTIGVTDPEAVDCTALAALLPRGRATVQAVRGGLDVVNPDTGERHVLAAAAVEAFLPRQS